MLPDSAPLPKPTLRPPRKRRQVPISAQPMAAKKDIPHYQQLGGAKSVVEILRLKRLVAVFLLQAVFHHYLPQKCGRTARENSSLRLAANLPKRCLALVTCLSQQEQWRRPDVTKPPPAASQSSSRGSSSPARSGAANGITWASVNQSCIVATRPRKPILNRWLELELAFPLSSVLSCPTILLGWFSTARTTITPSGRAGRIPAAA